MQLIGTVTTVRAKEPAGPSRSTNPVKDFSILLLLLQGSIRSTLAVRFGLCYGRW
jgi:hypothetical protein